jgi:hypothetical protein
MDFTASGLLAAELKLTRVANLALFIAGLFAVTGNNL